MLDLLTDAAAAFVGAVLKKPGEQLGEAISNQVQRVRELIARKFSTEAEVIEATIENPEANSEKDLMDRVVKLAQSDDEVREALISLKNTVEAQAQTSVKQRVKNLGNQFNATVINPTFNQTFN